ncbi:mitochondrial tRNA methylthiotransferase CDK5RAP1-like [Danio aesculapii]|uniref:mitochondrial tRNA methylthiotransferase CDK5RAP1-like n=1 Tax=Danio aesculapii TaxID=1142201 RepID=UPI0024C09BDF|nr:mitochondrial tRNA methylthiotransferase CDK5RAP1-like [Danio aesculapii]
MTLIGNTQLVLVEGESKRSSEELCGRNDGNVKVIFPKTNLPVQPEKTQMACITPGDYVLVKITSANSQSLRGHALNHSTLND